jgi:hypothetical protein
VEEKEYFLSLDNVSSDEANTLASELRDVVLDVIPDAAVTLTRENPLAQDFGATLVVVLGTPAVVTLANALGSWLKARQGGQGVGVTIKTASGELVGTNLTGKDAKDLVGAFLQQK